MSRLAIPTTDWRNMRRWHDPIIFLAVVLLALLLYIATLLPGIGSQDTPEFQRVAPTLGIAHPTGYPLYIILGWLWTRLPLGGTPAWKMNLLSAVLAAQAIGLLYSCSRKLGFNRIVAAAAALSLATSYTFWSQATITEVYALATLLQVLLIFTTLRWRDGQAPLWQVGLVLGLGLAHHRMIVLMLPGLALFVLLTRLPTWRELPAAAAALIAPCLLYLYLPLRAPAWVNRWQFLWDYATARSWAGTLLSFDRLRQEGSIRLLFLVQHFIWPQFLPLGIVIALLGVLYLLRHDRATAALLVATYGCVFVFCSAYYVNDVEVFLIPAHVVAALLIGAGSTTIVKRLPRRVALAAAVCLFTLPALLLSHNIETIRGNNSDNPELTVREIMAQPLPPQSVVVADWSYFEGLRYLQDVEQQRQDLELILTFNYDEHRQIILDRLTQQRAVFLLRPWPNLGLAQAPEGVLWKVSNHPPTVVQGTPIDIQWSEGINLTEYVLRPGPYHPGEIVPLQLAWKITEKPLHRYTLFVHLVSPIGQKWGQQDADAPTDAWQPGEHHVELYGPALSPSVPPGRYQVIIGWYNQRSMERLQLQTEAGDVRDHLTIGEIEVED